MVPFDPARCSRRGTAARARSRRSASRGGPRRGRSARPPSTASGAPERRTRDRARARRAPRWRSRDARRGPGRTCRRTRQRASLVSRLFAPLHLELADPDGVALLGSKRTELALDSRANELALEVGGRIRGLPVDARGKALDAIALDAEGRALTFDMPIAAPAGECDAALARSRRARRFARWAAIEDLAEQLVGALACRRRDRDACDAARGKCAGESRRGLAGL